MIALLGSVPVAALTQSRTLFELGLVVVLAALPEKDREGEPTMFDSCDQTALLAGTGPSTRDHWIYQVETELFPGRFASGSGRPSGTSVRIGWGRPSTRPRGQGSSISGKTRKSATTSS